MDGIRRRKPLYSVQRQISLKGVIMLDKLWTHGLPGLYKAEFYDATAEMVRGRRGKEYARLVIKFRLIEGPLVFSAENDNPECKMNYGAGKLAALWHELEILEGGRLGLSPNWFLAGDIMTAPGKNIDEKVRQALGGVNWVVCKRRGTGPLKVCGLSWAESFPERSWVTECLEGDE